MAKLPIGFALPLLLAMAPQAFSYSVLTHEAIIDSAWEGSIKPLLLERFPDASAAQLKQAHAYAYGGSIIQDMGYYPFGSHLFTDLLHYVRSGDFVLNLIRESQNLNEYAFSLGALAHYAGDINGHRFAVNLAVPDLYPKLRLRFGPVVTYADDPLAHIKTEVGFDALEVAQGHYAPQGYHDFIGFEVAKAVLERAFEDTYGLKLNDMFLSTDLALGTYRYAVSSLIPELTRVAWQMKKNQIVLGEPGMTRKRFLYNMSHASFRKEWGTNYQKPGFGTRFIAFILKLMPKIGPLKILQFRKPTPETERVFMASVNDTINNYREFLSAQRAGQLRLANLNLDLGELTQPGRYKLCDQAYAELLDKLHGHYSGIPFDLRANILAFYSDQNAPIATKADGKAWSRVVRELSELETTRPAPQL